MSNVCDVVVGSSTAQKDSAQKKKKTARQKEIDDVLRSLELDASANGTATQQNASLWYREASTATIDSMPRLLQYHRPCMHTAPQNHYILSTEL
jgi:hypothetical protein